MLGIIGAMAQEVRQLKEAMEQPRIETVAGMEFYRGTIGGKETVVVQSGIGKVSAGICAQILVDRFGVGGIINTGIAGSLKAEINIGDLVMSTDALQHDVDAVNFGYEPGQIPQLPVKAFPTDDRLRKLAMELCARVNPDIRAHGGRVLTGDQFISDKAKKQWLTSTFGGACTEMEGAAIAQAAYLNQVPVLIIRAISDKADDSASMDYGAFEELAILHSVRLTRALIEAWE